MLNIIHKSKLHFEDTFRTHEARAEFTAVSTTPEKAACQGAAATSAERRATPSSPLLRVTDGSPDVEHELVGKGEVAQSLVERHSKLIRVALVFSSFEHGRS